MKSILEFANVICRFGDKEVLLDYAESIVIPAFLDRAMQRKYAGIRYFFYDSQIFLEEYEGEKLVILAGRFVKDMVQRSSQYFDDSVGIVKRTEKMKDAPSSIYILVLNNHKLLYIHETPHAPSLQAFKSTMSYFVRRKRVEVVENMYAEISSVDKTATKKNIHESIPIPIVEIVPLSSSLDLKQFMSNYRLLKSVKVRLLNTNHEDDDSALWKGLRKAKNDLQAKSSEVDYVNNEGLNQDKALKLLGAAAQQGNTEIVLKGEDFDGDRMSGNNNDFRMRIPFDVRSGSVPDLVMPAYAKFMAVQQNGLINLPQVAEEAKIKATSLYESIRSKK